MNKILNAIGYSENLDGKNKVAFIIAVIGTFQILMFQLFYIVFSVSWLLIIQTVFVFIAYISFFLFFRRKHYILGKAMIINVMIVQVALLVFFWFPEETHFAYYYFIVPPISFFILDMGNTNERKLLIYSNSFVAVLCLISTMVSPLELLSLQPVTITIFSTLTILSTIFVEWLVFYMYARDLQNTHKELKVLANTDSLTNISNRRVLFDQGEMLFRIHSKYRKPFALMLIDIDHFKIINDRYGHPAGDKVLQEMTDLISRNIRKEDLLCRYGGEEFAILLRNVDENYISIIKEVKEKIEHNDFNIDSDTHIHVTISAGVVSCKYNCQSFEELVQKADKLLYAAKESGRNKIVFEATESV